MTVVTKYSNVYECLVFLVQLSPKKTWEGFIGAFFFTVIFGLTVSPINAP